MKHSALRMTTILILAMAAFAAAAGSSPMSLDEAVAAVSRNRTRVLARYTDALVDTAKPSVDLRALAAELRRCSVPIFEPRRVELDLAEEPGRKRLDVEAFDKAFAEAGDDVGGLELAKVLYKAGKYQMALPMFKAAYEIYEKAEDRETCAWILLMAADCERANNPETAAGLYQNFLKTFPDSPWYAFADFRAKLLAWQATQLNTAPEKEGETE